jgi:hypothetical protein
VCAVLDSAGALTETIKNDYGEDLLVQTQLGDIADDFHILIQVKGSNLRNTVDGNYRFSFDVAHLQRWISHPLPVLVCVFNELNGQIFAFYPRQMFSSWFLATTTKKRLSIRLTEGDIFDESSARRFIWSCRIELFCRALSWHENRFRYVENDVYGSGKFCKHIMNEGNLLVFNFLKSLGIIKGDEVSTNFRQMIRHCSGNFSKFNLDNPNEPLGLRHVFMLCLLGTVDHLAKTGLPGNLMEHGTDMAGHFFKTFHPDEWLRAGQNVGDTKWLRGRRDRKPSARAKALRT